MNVVAVLKRRLPLVATAAIAAVLFSIAGYLYDGFFSLRVLATPLTDYAPLGVTAVGMTLVIFCGGIDLSVGAVLGFSAILVATLVQSHGWHPVSAMALALALGAGLGAFMGTLIHRFRLPAFLITLAGMFLARGGAYWISQESTGITHPLYDTISAFGFAVPGDVFLRATSLVFLGTLLVGFTLGHLTRFGRNLLALGASEQSAVLMGLPVGPARIAAYTFSGFCAALAGLAFTFDTASGNPADGLGMELDAIAVVVIGGTLLSGGRGHLLGTVLGLLIFATIQQALLFDGRLGPAWSRIVVGALLLGFILLQRTLVRSAARR